MPLQAIAIEERLAAKATANRNELIDRHSLRLELGQASRQMRVHLVLELLFGFFIGQGCTVIEVFLHLSATCVFPI
ncbi:unnamed protein product [Fusarium venenatum]|uniref:Uncharacterized protein n=1 Tax=Fusarium venenatum TaxID=56646 RepID=A0A2L2SSA5_9HYPO|nr:uncharacterized protein FVRRES_04410 [Fusarium venenatum]CEI59974.1 unnamed protein product [Fusarium venenatum]